MDSDSDSDPNLLDLARSAETPAAVTRVPESETRRVTVDLVAVGKGDSAPSHPSSESDLDLDSALQPA